MISDDRERYYSHEYWREILSGTDHQIIARAFLIALNSVNKERSAEQQFFWDASRQDWSPLPERLAARWEKAYPAVNIKAELAKARVWLINNPRRQFGTVNSKKARWERFMANWLCRALERTQATGHEPPQVEVKTFDSNASWKRVIVRARAIATDEREMSETITHLHPVGKAPSKEAITIGVFDRYTPMQDTIALIQKACIDVLGEESSIRFVRL